MGITWSALGREAGPYAGIGARKTPLAIQTLMERAAAELASRRFTLRSGGNPKGADAAFERGVPAGGAKEIFLPWRGFEGRRDGVFAANLSIAMEAEEIARAAHPIWDQLSRGVQAMHARNVHQVLGADLRSPSKFIMCWTEAGRTEGGTGQALRIAFDRGIPVYNLGRPGNAEALARALDGETSAVLEASFARPVPTPIARSTPARRLVKDAFA